MDSHQLKQKLSNMRAQLAAKEKKLEMENRLLDLKKEMAAKQKKLQKAERVAKVKSHVKNKLCELRASNAKKQFCDSAQSSLVSSNYSLSNIATDNDIAMVQLEYAARPSQSESQSVNCDTPILDKKMCLLANAPMVNTLIESSFSSTCEEAHSELNCRNDQYTPLKRRISKTGKSLPLENVRTDVIPGYIRSCSGNDVSENIERGSFLSQRETERDVSLENETKIPINTKVTEQSSKQFDLGQAGTCGSYVDFKSASEIHAKESQTTCLKEPSRKRPHRQRRSDWTERLPRRKSMRVSSPRTSLSLNNSFLQAFSQHSQESNNGHYNEPRCLPRWHEGLSQLSQVPKLPKTRRTWTFFPPLPKLVVEQHCFHANFVEFSLPTESFGDICCKNLSMKTNRLAQQKLTTGQIIQFPQIPNHLTEKLNIGDGFVEFSLQSKEFNFLLSQKSSCSPTLGPVLHLLPRCGGSPKTTVGTEHLATSLTPKSTCTNNEIEADTVCAPFQTNNLSEINGVEKSERIVQSKNKQDKSDLNNSNSNKVSVAQKRHKNVMLETDDQESRTVTTEAEMTHANIEMYALKSKEKSKSVCVSKKSKVEKSGPIMTMQKLQTLKTYSEESFSKTTEGELASKTENCKKVLQSHSIVNIVAISKPDIMKTIVSVDKPSGEFPEVNRDVTEQSVESESEPVIKKQFSTTVVNKSFRSDDNKLINSNSGLKKGQLNILSQSTHEAPCENTSANVVFKPAQDTSSQPTVIGETQDLSELLSPNVQCSPETLVSSIGKVDLGIINIINNLDDNPVSSQLPEYCEDTWTLTDGLQVGQSKVELILSGAVWTRDGFVDYVVVVNTSSTVSVWKYYEKTWSEVQTFANFQDHSDVKGFTFLNQNCVKFVLLWSDDKTESDKGMVVRLDLDGSDIQTWCLSLLLSNYPSRWVGCAVPDGWAVFGQFHKDTTTSKLWRCQFVDPVTTRVLPLESVPGCITSLCPLKGRDDALIGYGLPSCIHLWNQSERVVLMSVDLTMNFIELRTAQECEGLLYAVFMCQEDLTNLGCVVVVNPNTKVSKVCHCLKSSSKILDLTERYSAIQDGLLMCWDKKQLLRMNIYSGELNSWTHLPPSNACTTFSSNRLFLATESGLINVYSNQ